MSWHRRKLAVLAAVAAVLTAITAAAPPEAATVTVVRVVAGLEAGSTIEADQVRLDELPATAVPEDPIDELDAVIGRTVLAGVPVGQVLTGDAILSPAIAPPGRVLAPLRLTDPDVVALLSAGDRVDVLSADGEGGAAVVLAHRARIVAVPAAPSSGTGLGASAGSPGALVLVDVDPATASRLAQAAASASLSIVLRS